MNPWTWWLKHAPFGATEHWLSLPNPSAPPDMNLSTPVGPVIPSIKVSGLMFSAMIMFGYSDVTSAETTHS
jgi:hypothetical protein